MEAPAPGKAADGGPPVPSWAMGAEAGEASPFSLEVIKDGVSVERVAVDRSRFLVGRAADQVALALAHASISRVHGVADCALRLAAGGGAPASEVTHPVHSAFRRCQ